MTYFFILGVDPAAESNRALDGACSGGHLDVVKLLIACPGVSPTANESRPIRSAANEEIVRYLVSLPGVDADLLFQNAAEAGETRAVEYLSSCPQVNTGLASKYIKNIVMKGHLDVVRFLVTLPGVEMTTDKTISDTLLAYVFFPLSILIPIFFKIRNSPRRGHQKSFFGLYWYTFFVLK